MARIRRTAATTAALVMPMATDRIGTVIIIITGTDSQTGTALVRRARAPRFGAPRSTRIADHVSVFTSLIAIQLGPDHPPPTPGKHVSTTCKVVGTLLRRHPTLGGDAQDAFSLLITPTSANLPQPKNPSPGALSLLEFDDRSVSAMRCKARCNSFDDTRPSPTSTRQSQARPGLRLQALGGLA